MKSHKEKLFCHQEENSYFILFWGWIVEKIKTIINWGKKIRWYIWEMSPREYINESCWNIKKVVEEIKTCKKMYKEKVVTKMKKNCENLNVLVMKKKSFSQNVLN